MQGLDLLLRPLLWFSRRDPRASLDDVQRILVFESGSLGDIVMCMPALENLRRGFPNARISLMCRASGAQNGYSVISQSSIEALLLDQGFVDELIPVVVPWLVDVSPWRRYNPFALGWARFVRQLWRLRQRKFELGFAGGRSDVRHNLALWLTGAQRRVGYGYAGGGRFLTDEVCPNMERPHQSELTLQLLEYLGVATRRDGRRLKLLAEDREFSAEFFREHGVKVGDFVVGVHSGARVLARQWGTEKFAEVARRLASEFDAKVIWFQEPNCSEPSPEGKNIIPAAFPLRKFLAVLSHCQFLVCNESGPMHLASAVGVPSVAIFGAGFPEWFRALGDSNQVVIRRDVPCRPCGDRCIWNEPYCLRLISVERVMEAVEKALAGKRLSPVAEEARA